MSGLPGNHQAPRTPTATAGSIDSKGDISQIVQAAGRDINQSRTGSVKIYIINTKNVTKNVFISLDPHAEPEEGARVVRQILAESSDSESENLSSELQPKSSADPVFPKMVMEASKWDDIGHAIRTLQPKFKKAGCSLFQLENTTPDDDTSQVFRIIQGIQGGDLQKFGAGEPSNISHLESSAVYTISDGNFSRAQSPVPSRNGSSSSALNERVPSLTAGTDSNEASEQGTPEVGPQILPLTSEGKILDYSYDGWVDERDERLKLLEEADVKHLKFMEWLLRHLMILIFLQWIWNNFYGDHDRLDEMDDDLSAVAEHDDDGPDSESGASTSGGHYGSGNEDGNEDQDPLWWLDPQRATCFEAWRDPFPEINSSFSESSGGSNNSSSARQDTPPPSNDTDSSENGFYYDADLCDEPADLDGESESKLDVMASGLAKEERERANMMMALEFGERDRDGGSNWVRGSAMGKGVDVGGDMEMEMSSEEVKERLGIPSDVFGYPGAAAIDMDNRIVSLRLGIRRRQTSRF